MSQDGSVELVFGGDVRRFRLGIASLLALQGILNSGPLEICTRLQLGTWRLDDITETLRLALIGGDTATVPDAKAWKKLVEDNVRPGNITPHALTALAVLLSALQGDPDDPVGKTKRRRASRGRKTASPPPPSTAPAQ
jgi:hypothetical protein